jgi:hypothetical protein
MTIEEIKKTFDLPEVNKKVEKLIDFLAFKLAENSVGSNKLDSDDLELIHDTLSFMIINKKSITYNQLSLIAYKFTQYCEAIEATVSDKITSETV